MKQLLLLLEAGVYRIFQTPETTFVFLLGIGLVALTLFIGDLLIPVFFSIAISYIMVGFKYRLMRLGLPPVLSLAVSYVLFFSILFFILFVLFPVIIRQLGELAIALPDIFDRIKGLVQGSLMRGDGSSSIDINALINSVLPELTARAAEFSTSMLGYLGNMLTLAIYAVLVPVMVFFLMKDYMRILAGVSRFMPGQKKLAVDLWVQIDQMLSNYMRGKVLEIIVVWLAAQILFSATGLDYAVLLALLTGLSVVVPIVGAMVVTLPVIVIAFMQWDLSLMFWVLAVGYTVLQIVDGYILVPLIFSETMKIHSLIVIISVLIFGGIWGFWGAFLAIPLATLIKILLESWPAPELEAESTA